MAQDRADGIVSGGPWFDELAVGRVFDDAPAVTLTEGLAALHGAVLGDRLRMPLDAGLSARVAGAHVAHPGLVWDIAIGHSSLATHRVKANLFYRGLRFHRYPALGDTLHTRTEVVALRENAPRPGRAPTGLAALRITTVDQDGHTVLDFHRCPMLPLSPHPDPGRPRHADDLSAVGAQAQAPPAAPAGWDLAAFRAAVPGGHFSPALAGASARTTGDVVSASPELARMTMNIAAAHHDERAAVGEGRLVYGGHTIGLALAQATRALPNLVTVLGWERCDHTGPVREADTLYSDVAVERAEPLPGGGGVVHLHALVHAHRPGAEDRPVLDWRFAALMA